MVSLPNDVMADCWYSEKSAGLASVAGRDGALGLVERDLAVERADRLQPVLRATRVRGTHGEREGVGEEVEDAVGAGDRQVDVVGRGLLAGLLERRLGPVAHDVERRGAVDDLLRGVRPVEAVTVLVGVADGFWKSGERLGDLGAGPVGRPVPEARVAVGAEVGDQDGLEQVDLGPGRRDGERREAGLLLDGVHGDEPVVQRGVGRGGVETRALQHARGWPRRRWRGGCSTGSSRSCRRP